MPVSTFNCSCVGRYTDEAFLGDVESVYFYNPAFWTDSFIIAAATPESFFATLNQGGDAFVDQLHDGFYTVGHAHAT